MSSPNESYPTHVLSGDIIPPEQLTSGNHYVHPDIPPWPYTHEQYQTQQLQAAQPRKQKHVPTPPSTPQAPDGCMWYVHPVTGKYDIMRIPEQSPRTKGGKRRKLIKSPKTKTNIFKATALKKNDDKDSENEEEKEDELDTSNWTNEQMRLLIESYKEINTNTSTQTKSTTLWNDITELMKTKGMNRSVKANKNKFQTMHAMFK